MQQTDKTIKVLNKIFTVFEPLTSNPNVIPACGGNYIFALKEGRQLPEIEELCVMQRVNFGERQLEVIYTGIGRDLYDRIIKTHFGKNAGRSTLRKSLGSLMGLEKINRDSKENGKTKFTVEGERMVTEWMCQNLFVFVAENPDFEEDEQRFIDFLNPPLNLDKNSNPINSDYRKKLSALRNSGETRRTVNVPKTLKPTICGSSRGKGLYIDLWKKYLPIIKSILLEGNKSEQIITLSIEDFKNCGGDRADYSFRLEFENGITNNIGGSAVARNLFSVIQEDTQLWDFQKKHSVLIRMNRQFEVSVSAI